MSCAVLIRTKSVITLAVRHRADGAAGLAFIKKDFVIPVGTIGDAYRVSLQQDAEVIHVHNHLE